MKTFKGRGVVHGCRAFIPQLQARPGSVIVNISSIFAMVSMPTQSIYNASKAAVRGFSDALREELRGSCVRVLCVHPGGIQTRIAQQARLGDWLYRLWPTRATPWLNGLARRLRQRQPRA
jgi:NADP-dependent 3-hydroxy acid dehydrogenase YdfG